MSNSIFYYFLACPQVHASEFASYNSLKGFLARYPTLWAGIPQFVVNIKYFGKQQHRRIKEKGCLDQNITLPC